MMSLHTAVSVDSLAMIDACEPPALPGERGNEPVAIIGMACIFPWTADVESFWVNILEGRDLVSEVPAGRWNPALYHHEGAEAPGGTIPSKWGGLIADVPFNPWNTAHRRSRSRPSSRRSS